MAIKLSTNDIRKLKINLTREEMDSICEYCLCNRISLEEFMYEAINTIEYYAALEEEYKNQILKYGSK